MARYGGPGLRARVSAAADGLRGRRPVVALAVVAALVAGAWGATALGRDDGTRITAWFDSAVGLYEGSDLRVLGVRVGSVDSVTPQGERVRVELTLDDDVPVPADAEAVVVSPSVVSGRYVQLAPAYTGGPRLREGDEIPVERTATPVEIDQLYASITELTDALGPEGANKDGALSELIGTGARNLDGNGKAIGDSIDQFGDATRTLSGRSDDLFGTIENLQSFTAMLKRNDKQVRKAERRLAEVTTFLAEDKDELAGALRELGTALGRVQGFIKDNRGRIKGNVDRLADLTETLVDNRASLAEALDTLPLAADNVLRAYNPSTRTLDGRANMNELTMGGDIVPPGQRAGQAVTDLVPVPRAERDALPELPLPPVGEVYGPPGAADERGGDR